MPCERFGSCIWELKVHEAGDDKWLPADIRILTDGVTHTLRDAYDNLEVNHDIDTRALCCLYCPG